jgi:dipeptidyl aminopeptidase/acylaminoacyl peptidase
LYRVGVGTVGEKELLLETPVNVYADSISPDGKMLVYVHTGYSSANDGNRHVFALPLVGDRKPVQMTSGQFIESFPKTSPDGRWLSYASTATGRSEIQIQSFPTPRVRLQVSTTGGTEAMWSADGRELFYLTFEGKLMSVPLKATADGLQAGAPVALFTPPLFSSPGGSQQFAVARDGRFLVNVPTEGAPLTLTVVLNWPSSMHEPTASR